MGLGKIFMGLGAAALMMAAAPVSGQRAVPLTEALLSHSWVVVEFPGWTDQVGVDGPVTFERDGRSRVVGMSPCGEGWMGTLSVNLPAISISDVESFYENSCPLMRETVSFLNNLELVRSARTSPEGLELLSAKGKRLFLLVAGG